METWTLLSSFAGLITAIAALVTVLEMKRQRESGYKPDLVVVSPVSLQYKGTAGFPPFTTGTIDDPPTETKRWSAFQCHVDCINIGAGAARDLNAIWRFNRQGAIECIAASLANRKYRIWLDSDVTRLDFEEDGRSVMTIFTDPLTRWSAPFLFPGKSPENVFRLRLPPDYLLFLGLSVSCLPASGADEARAAPLPSIPPLELEISYTDVGGDRRGAKFTLHFEFQMFSLKNLGDGLSALDDATAVGVATRC